LYLPTSTVSTVSGKKGKGSGKLKVLVLGSDDDMRGEKACLVMLKHMPEGAEVLAVGPKYVLVLLLSG